VASGNEQARLGFNALSRNELEEMKRLNRRYRDRFGFPCIVALRLHADRQSVVTEMKRRLTNDADSELRNALEQIGHITRGRLERIFDG
jgi:2-oxo-4-hydroxy-4-carboxy--5-ureidoimidazoline (OHCU) decarboxylase